MGGADQLAAGTGPGSASEASKASEAAVPTRPRPPGDVRAGGRHQERTTAAAEPDEGATGEPPASTAGAAPMVAAAVAQALAARAASIPVGDPARVEARDRLLAVLLDDPARAVGATMDLAACLDQLTRLTGAVREGRARLGEAITRLAGAGLTPDQLARLSGLPDDEVRQLLA